MRGLLIFLLIIISQLHTYCQLATFPYNQDFEKSFLDFGSNVEFIEDWVGNEVRNTNSRIFQTDQFVRSGNKALAVQPISSFDCIINIELDLSDVKNLRVQFYARTIKNGTGSRPVLVYISTTIDGGNTYIKHENVGDETSFPNLDTDYALYTYDLPNSAGQLPDVSIKIEVKYTPAFGEGTAGRFVLDDFSIFEKDEDLKIQDVIQLNHEKIQVLFNDEVDKTTAEAKENYSFTPTNSIISIERNEQLKNSVTIELLKELKDGEHNVKVQNIFNLHKDKAIDVQEFTFNIKPIPQHPEFNELIITEIMADPVPKIGLPESEYIEIYNPTNKTISLQDIVFSDASTSAKLPDSTLASESYVTLVPKNSINLFDERINTIGTSPWPALNINGDQLSLTNSDGQLIYSIEYDKSWHSNSLKSDGGWSLEMIDIHYPCAGKENWGSSEANLGGTPSALNSINANQPDITSLKLLSASATQSDKVLLRFNKKIHPEFHNVADLIIVPEIKIESIEIDEPSLTQLSLLLAEKLQNEIIYEVQVNYLKDCAGNLIDDNYKALTFGISQPADSLDLVVNEVLFNSRVGGVKFVEVYNNSEKFINIKNWRLGNNIDIKNSTLKPITNDDYILDPKSYLAITTDKAILKSEYPKGKEENFYEISSFPGYTISDGTVVLHNDRGDVIDAINYADDYHSALLRDTKGVSLERISFDGPSNHKSNWQSSASTVGFATPGYMNSQAKSTISSVEQFSVVPKVIVPDNSGTADFAQINYKFDVPGNFGSLKILDTKGKLIKKIAKNEKLSTEGFFTWDGTDENNLKVRIGYYLVYFEIYNLSGKTETHKETVVVGKRF